MRPAHSPQAVQPGASETRLEWSTRAASSRSNPARSSRLAKAAGDCSTTRTTAPRGAEATPSPEALAYLHHEDACQQATSSRQKTPTQSPPGGGTQSRQQLSAASTRAKIASSRTSSTPRCRHQSRVQEWKRCLSNRSEPHPHEVTTAALPPLSAPMMRKTQKKLSAKQCTVATTNEQQHSAKKQLAPNCASSPLPKAHTAQNDNLAENRDARTNALEGSTQPNRALVEETLACGPQKLVTHLSPQSPVQRPQNSNKIAGQSVHGVEQG